MNLQAYLPQKLSGLVNMIWEQKATERSGWKILPSGFVELIFMIGPGFDKVRGRLIDESFNPTDHFCFLSGLHTKPLTFEFSLFHAIGIQLHPIAVKAIFGIPCSEVRDWAVEGDQILNELAEIQDYLCAEEIPFSAKAAWLEEWLVKKIKDQQDWVLALQLKQVVRKAKRALLTGKRGKLEDLTGYSRMHTHQLFNDWFGLAPGQTLRLHQYTYSLGLLQHASLNLTEVGMQSGFYDQAHFIRVFRAFTDMTPGTYQKQLPPLIGQFPV